MGRSKGGVKNVKQAVAVEVFCFLCHRKDYNYAYAFTTGCMENCLVFSRKRLYIA